MQSKADKAYRSTNEGSVDKTVVVEGEFGYYNPFEIGNQEHMNSQYYDHPSKHEEDLSESHVLDEPNPSSQIRTHCRARVTHVEDSAQYRRSSMTEDMDDIPLEELDEFSVLPAASKTHKHESIDKLAASSIQQHEV